VYERRRAMLVARAGVRLRLPGVQRRAGFHTLSSAWTSAPAASRCLAESMSPERAAWCKGVMPCWRPRALRQPRRSCRPADCWTA
jgi:hypothetical protein